MDLYSYYTEEQGYRDGSVLDEPDATVCLHHEQKFVHKFIFLQKTCFDPLHTHKRPAKTNFKVLSAEDADK